MQDPPPDAKQPPAPGAVDSDENLHGVEDALGAVLPVAAPSGEDRGLSDGDRGAEIGSERTAEAGVELTAEAGMELQPGAKPVALTPNDLTLPDSPPSRPRRPPTRNKFSVLDSPPVNALRRALLQDNQPDEPLLDLMWLVGAHPELIGHAQVFAHVAEALATEVFAPDNLAWMQEGLVRRLEPIRTTLHWLFRNEAKLRRIAELEPYFRQPKKLGHHVILHHGVIRHPLCAALWNRYELSHRHTGGVRSDTEDRFLLLRTQVLAGYMNARVLAGEDQREIYLRTRLDQEFCPLPIGFRGAGLTIRELSHARYGSFLRKWLPTISNTPQFLEACCSKEDERLLRHDPDPATREILAYWLDLIAWFRALYRRGLDKLVPPRHANRSREGRLFGEVRSRPDKQHDPHPGYIEFDASQPVAQGQLALAEADQVGAVGDSPGDDEEPEDAHEEVPAGQEKARVNHPGAATPRLRTGTARGAQAGMPTEVIVTTRHMLAGAGLLDGADPVEREEAVRSDPATLELSGLCPAEDAHAVAQLFDPMVVKGRLSKSRMQHAAREQAAQQFEWGSECCRPSEILTVCAAIAGHQKSWRDARSRDGAPVTVTETVPVTETDGPRWSLESALLAKAGLTYGWSPEVTSRIVCAVIEPDAPQAMQRVLQGPSQVVRLVLERCPPHTTSHPQEAAQVDAHPRSPTHRQSFRVVGFAVPALSPQYMTVLPAEFDASAEPTQANFLLPDSLGLGADLLQLAEQTPDALPPGDTPPVASPGNRADAARTDSVCTARKPVLGLQDNDATRALRKFLRTLRDPATVGTKQTLQPSRLLRTMGHAITQVAADQVATWMLTLDAKKRSEPRLFYTQLTPSRLLEIHDQALKRAVPETARQLLLAQSQWEDSLATLPGHNSHNVQGGQDGQDGQDGQRVRTVPTVQTPPAGRVGCRFVARKDVIKSAVHQLLDEVRRGPDVYDGAAVIRYHNTFVLYVWLWEAIAAAPRASANFTALKEARERARSLFVSAVPDTFTLCSVVGKHHGLGDRARLVAIDADLAEQIDAFAQHLQYIFGRLRDYHHWRELPARVQRLFALDENFQPIPVYPKWIEEQLAARGYTLPANFVRAFERSDLIASGHPGAIADALLGHVQPGRDPFGRFSSYDPQRGLELLVQYRRNLVADLGLKVVHSRLVPPSARNRHEARQRPSFEVLMQPVPADWLTYSGQAQVQGCTSPRDNLPGPARELWKAVARNATVLDKPLIDSLIERFSKLLSLVPPLTTALALGSPPGTTQADTARQELDRESSSSPDGQRDAPRDGPGDGAGDGPRDEPAEGPTQESAEEATEEATSGSGASGAWGASGRSDEPPPSDPHQGSPHESRNDPANAEMDSRTRLAVRAEPVVRMLLTGLAPPAQQWHPEQLRALEQLLLIEAARQPHARMHASAWLRLLRHALGKLQPQVYTGELSLLSCLDVDRPSPVHARRTQGLKVVDQCRSAVEQWVLDTRIDPPDSLMLLAAIVMSAGLNSMVHDMATVQGILERLTGPNRRRLELVGNRACLSLKLPSSLPKGEQVVRLVLDELTELLILRLPHQPRSITVAELAYPLIKVLSHGVKALELSDPQSRLRQLPRNVGSWLELLKGFWATEAPQVILNTASRLLGTTSLDQHCMDRVFSPLLLLGPPCPKADDTPRTDGTNAGSRGGTERKSRTDAGLSHHETATQDPLEELDHEVPDIQAVDAFNLECSHPWLQELLRALLCGSVEEAVREIDALAARQKTLQVIEAAKAFKASESSEAPEASEASVAPDAREPRQAGNSLPPAAQEHSPAVIRSGATAALCYTQAVRSFVIGHRERGSAAKIAATSAVTRTLSEQSAAPPTETTSRQPLRGLYFEMHALLHVMLRHFGDDWPADIPDAQALLEHTCREEPDKHRRQWLSRGLARFQPFLAGLADPSGIEPGATVSAQPASQPDDLDIDGENTEGVDARVATVDEHLKALAIIDNGIDPRLDPRDQEALRLMEIVGFRGGLRPTERTGLRVGDVDTMGGVFLLVREYPGHGLKTSNADRVVPLHLLAPEEELSVVRACVSQRKASLAHQGLTDREIHLAPLLLPLELGDPRIPAQDSKALAQARRPEVLRLNELHGLVLRKATGDPKFRPYLLRHSFATWTCAALLLHDCAYFQRALAGCPATARWVADGKQLGQRLLGADPATDPRGIAAITRLMGHLGGAMTIGAYIHVMDFARAHYSQKASAKRTSKMVLAAASNLPKSTALGHLEHSTTRLLESARKSAGWTVAQPASGIDGLGGVDTAGSAVAVLSARGAQTVSDAPGEGSARPSQAWLDPSTWSRVLAACVDQDAELPRVAQAFHLETTALHRALVAACELGPRIGERLVAARVRFPEAPCEDPPQVQPDTPALDQACAQPSPQLSPQPSLLPPLPRLPKATPPRMNASEQATAARLLTGMRRVSEQHPERCLRALRAYFSGFDRHFRDVAFRADAQALADHLWLLEMLGVEPRRVVLAPRSVTPTTRVPTWATEALGPYRTCSVKSVRPASRASAQTIAQWLGVRVIDEKAQGLGMLVARVMFAAALNAQARGASVVEAPVAPASPAARATSRSAMLAESPHV